MKKSSVFENVDTIIFADETKFNVNNGDIENAIFYFGIAASKRRIALIKKDLAKLLADNNFQGNAFHATAIFKESRPRNSFMKAMVKLFIDHKLKCFCYKYEPDKLFTTSLLLNSYNNDIINFKNKEFQALFYFLVNLNTSLRDNTSLDLGKKFLMFFDRNVYGRNETEEFSFPDKRFVVQKMVFVEKSEVDLLALPDFFGYLFRKAKIGFNSLQNEPGIQTSLLTQNCGRALTELTKQGLFHFLNQEDEGKLIKQMFKL